MTSIVTADHIGVIKIHDINTNKCIFNSSSFLKPSGVPVLHISWVDQSNEQYIVVAYADGLIQLIDTINDTLINTYTHCQSKSQSSKRSVYGNRIIPQCNRIAGLHVIKYNQTMDEANYDKIHDKYYLLTCSANGVLQFIELILSAGTESNYTYTHHLSKSEYHNDHNIYDNQLHNITSCIYDDECGYLILGGSEILPTVFQLKLDSITYGNTHIPTVGEKQMAWKTPPIMCIYQASNVPDTVLGIRIPVQIKSIAMNPVNHRQFVTVTGVLVNYSSIEAIQQRSRIRIYDTSHDMKKDGETTHCIADIEYIEYDINSVQYSGDGKYIIIGDNSGRTQLIDCTTYKLTNRLKPATGAVSHINIGHSVPVVDVSNNDNNDEVSEVQPVRVDELVAVCSSDRHVRIHNLSSKQMTYKLYCHQRLTQCMFSYKHMDAGNMKVEPTDSSMKDAGVDVRDTEIINESADADDDDVWNELHKKTSINKRRMKKNIVV